MKQSDMDSSFEKYRRDRTFRRLQSAADKRHDPKTASVLAQLEAAERSEVRSETLSREVHEFFADATRQAAGIVQQISQDHEQHKGLRLGSEIEDFLHDVIQRAETFMNALHQQRPDGAQTTDLEATMRNIVGPQLDGFRAEGTAQLQDKHLGQDPFFQELEEVSVSTPTQLTPQFQEFEKGTQFPSEMPPGVEEVAEQTIEPIDHDGPRESPVDWVETGAIEASDEPEAEPSEPAPEAHATPEPVSEAPPEPTPAPEPEPKSSPAVDVLPGLPTDVEKLKTTLKALVHSGVMQREEAQAMYRAMMTRR